MMADPINYGTASPPAARGLILAGLIVALCGTGASVAAVFSVLWPIPNGTVIRPMGLTLLLFEVALAALAITGVLGLISFVKGPRTRGRLLLLALNLVVSLAPVPAGIAAIEVVVAAHSLILN